MLEEWERCSDPQCRAYGGRHHVLCQLQSTEEKAAQAEGYYRAWREGHERYHKQRALYIREVNLWKGKFLMLKQENNALRRKLNDTPAT